MGKGARKKGPKQKSTPKVRDVFVGQPFEGLAAEPELIALREFVPSATAKLSLADGGSVTLGTVLPIGAGAYWVLAGEKAHLRWVRPEQENLLLQALARLSAAGELGLGEGSRYAGSFRAHGLLVPVWDLDPEAHAREWTEAKDQLGTRLDAALKSLDDEPLNAAERRARDGLIGRQLTIR